MCSGVMPQYLCIEKRTSCDVFISEKLPIVPKLSSAPLLWAYIFHALEARFISTHSLTLHGEKSPLL